MPHHTFSNLVQRLSRGRFVTFPNGRDDDRYAVQEFFEIDKVSAGRVWSRLHWQTAEDFPASDAALVAGPSGSVGQVARSTPVGKCVAWLHPVLEAAFPEGTSQPLHGPRHLDNIIAERIVTLRWVMEASTCQEYLDFVF